MLPTATSSPAPAAAPVELLLPDLDGQDRSLDDFRGTALPMTYVVGGEGAVRYMGRGPLERDTPDIVEALEPVVPPKPHSEFVTDRSAASRAFPERVLRYSSHSHQQNSALKAFLMWGGLGSSWQQPPQTPLPG